MSWWEEAENRALRAKAPVGLAQTLLQRLEAAGLDGEAALAPCYALGQVPAATADLVQVSEGVLLAADGDRAALRRQALLLRAWARQTLVLCETCRAPLAGLLDRLEPDDRRAAADLTRETAAAHAALAAPAPPAAAAKQAGRFARWHLLYERLDIKLAAAGLPASLARGLGREWSESYAELLSLYDRTQTLLTGPARRGEVVRYLLDAHATLHYSLPHHLGVHRPAGGAPQALALQGWLILLLVETGGEGSIFNVSP